MFRPVFADHCLKGAPAFDNCVMKPMAIFNSPDEQVGNGLLEDVAPAEQSLTHVKMATKRPMDCEDTKAGAKPRRNFAPDKRSNLNIEAFRATWGQVSGRFDIEESEESPGVIKYSIKIQNGGATVTLDTNQRSATLVNQGSSNPGVQSAFEAAVTAAGVKK